MKKMRKNWTRNNRRKELSGTKLVRLVVISVLAILLIWYTWSKISPLVQGPDINIDNISHGQVVHTAVLTVTGTAQRAQEITLNTETLTLFNVDHFETTLALAPGYNLIVLTATDRFGQKNSERLEIYYDRDRSNY